jgi:hypothetical protein
MGDKDSFRSVQLSFSKFFASYSPNCPERVDVTTLNTRQLRAVHQVADDRLTDQKIATVERVHDYLVANRELPPDA